MEDEVRQHLNEQFPCPWLSGRWVATIRQKIEETSGIIPEDSWDAFIGKLDDLALDTPFSISAEPGTGIIENWSLSTMCTRIPGPVVLELSHVTDIGVSAFTLNQVRCSRDRSFHRRLATLAERHEVATEQTLLEIRQALPQYPRGCLQLSLTDGTRELRAIELEELSIRLGGTSMGVKVQLVDFPVVNGVAYLRRDNVTILGGRVEDMESPHLHRLAGELYTRMQEELVLARARLNCLFWDLPDLSYSQAEGKPIASLFRDRGVREHGVLDI